MLLRGGADRIGLQRALSDAGLDCIVVAPSLVPKKAGDRVKTDGRDAVKLARFLRSGDLTAVHIPDEATEAMRDLERARDDAKRAERVARHQLSKFLLRHGHRYPGKTTWTTAHHAWLRGLKFEQPVLQHVLDDYIKAVEDLRERVKHLTDSIKEFVESWHLKPLVKALQALRGVRDVSAVVLAAEIGDFARFESASRFMSFAGLVPSERSSGAETRRGAITRAGNGHVRRILVESAWAYRHRPGMSAFLRRRSKGISTEVQRIAWRAQERLCARYRKMTGRGKNKNTVITAIARELAGFVWAIAREPKLLAS